MRITDPEVIKSGEKDLIESVQADLDLDAVREVLKKRMSMAALASRGGQIVVHNNEVAFRLDFDIQLSGSLLFDRQGNLIDDGQDQGPRDSDSDSSGPVTKRPDKAEEAFLSPEPETDLGELSIDLPDYDLEDDLMDQDLAGPGQGDVPAAPAREPVRDLEADLARELEDEDLVGLESASSDPKQTRTEKPERPDVQMGPQDLDDDIDSLLKESRTFWEQDSSDN